MNLKAHLPQILFISGFITMAALMGVSVTLALIGATFMVFGAVGVYRMPDVYCRMHALSKATTMGVAFILLALANELNTPGHVTKIWLAIFFLILTVPISTHAIGRASYLAGFPWFRKATVDEWNRFGQAPSAVLFQHQAPPPDPKHLNPAPSGE